MKYIRRTSQNFKRDFLKNLLLDRNVIKDDANFLNKFFNPTTENLLDYNLLDDIDKAADLIEYHIKNGNKIYLCVDSDADGFTSSIIFYSYIIKNYRNEYPDFTIDYHIPESKEHGLRTLMNDLRQEKKYDLIVLPDAGSNDLEEHLELKQMGYDICCLDHHNVSKKSQNAIVVNNQSSENYSNKSLSGVGVVYKLLQLLDERNGWNDANNYLDLVALGEISDMMDMNTLENRFICDYGLSHIKNFLFKTLIKKQSYSLFGIRSEDWNDALLFTNELTQIKVAFYITPLINALIRVGTSVDKEKLFLAFFAGEEQVKSTKRGASENEMECLAEQVARTCLNAKNKQNREKEKAMELLNIQIIENCLDDNKILVLNADELDIPNTITGLCAMGVAAEHKKPVMLGRISPDGFLKGSIRGRDGSELKDFRSFLLGSGLMEFVEGHSQAAGFSLPSKNIEKLIQYANKELANIDFNEGYYEADFIVNGNCSYLDELIDDLDSGQKFFGQGNKEPVIVIENIPLPAGGYSIIGANKDTLRFEFNGITYIKFKAKELIEQLNGYSNSLILTIAGKGNINEWGGRRKPQILIDEIEIKESEIFDF